MENVRNRWLPPHRIHPPLASARQEIQDPARKLQFSELLRLRRCIQPPPEYLRGFSTYCGSQHGPTARRPQLTLELEQLQSLQIRSIMKWNFYRRQHSSAFSV